jgi:hypothetical protein
VLSSGIGSKEVPEAPIDVEGYAGNETSVHSKDTGNEEEEGEYENTSARANNQYA